MQLHYEPLDAEDTPLGTLTLWRYRTPDGTEGYEIRIGDQFLMAAHGAHSEAAMARLAFEHLTPPRRARRVLVGGLGAGHTLRAALDLPGVRAVTVAEIGSRVVAWNRLYFGPFNGHALDDPRVRVVAADLYDVLAAAPATFDLALLDVDNGPGWLAAPGNARLYTPAGLRHTARALAPGGVLAVWSPGPNATLLANLGEAGYARVTAVDTQAIGRAVGEPGDVVYLAVCPGAG